MHASPALPVVLPPLAAISGCAWPVPTPPRVAVCDLVLPRATPPLAAVPDLPWYDEIWIATSGGKDSQTVLRHVVFECHRQGYPLSRVRAVHADLGRVEWPGVVELARAQAAHYGLDLVIAQREGKPAPRGGRCYAKGEPYGDLLEDIRRLRHWPRPATRVCTANRKRDPIKLEIGLAAKRIAKDLPKGRPVRILNVMGLRGAESSKRAELPALRRDYESSRRIVDIWLPIHNWTEPEVWRDIWASGVRWHWAYDMGLPRLSCTLCILAPVTALVRAAILRLGLAKEYAGVEREIGHRFREKLSISDLADEIGALSPLQLARTHGADRIASWKEHR